MSSSFTDRLLSKRMQRRGFLIAGGTAAGVILAQQWAQPAQAKTIKFSSYPFTLGIASGEPTYNGVVLWTRLAPDPLNGGGMPNVNVRVDYTIATDESLRNVVKRGSTVAPAALGHSVHVEVSGLQPGREYWYRFESGGEESPVGRTRTAPAKDSIPGQFTFALASCQDYQNGFYTAYQNMAQEDLDLVIHVGDYIYEYGPQNGAVRQHSGPEIVTLADYRNRYAQYKLDPNLAAAHAMAPWVCTWDDHEVDNNYAGLIAEDDQDRKELSRRRMAAYQAYYEHMPLGRSAMPRPLDYRELQLYRKLNFGDLLSVNVLDTRQYRSDQPCGDTFGPRCEASFDAAATMTGNAQERWLLNNLQHSDARWNVLAQQTMFAQFDFGASAFSQVPLFNPDQWDGYVAQRDRLTRFLQQSRPSNPIVLTGDIHSSWVHDIKTDFNNPDSETVGTEFICTSITSSFGGAEIDAFVRAAVPNNPHTQYFNGLKHGYVRCTVTPDLWRTDFRVVDTVTEETGSVSTEVSFVVENGQPGAKTA